MSAVIRFFRGETTLRLTGAAPEECLGRLASRRIGFRRAERIDDFTYTVRVCRRDEARAAAEAARAQCTCEVIKRAGAAQLLSGLRYRAAIALALAAVIAALCILPQFIWTLDVVGCESLHEEQVLRALESIGVGFGTWGPSVDIQTIKNRMLALLPQLEWIAVNRSGGRATVLIHERVEAPEIATRRGAVNIVAARTGIITEMQVYSGDAVVKSGQTVLRGELLVTGCLERTNGVHFTHAMAEVYARTWHELTVVMPKNYTKKTYTGEEKTQYALILGHRRINFYANSGIPGAKCDKMTEMIPLTLPGGETLPATLLCITYRAYDESPAAADADAACGALEAAAKDYVTGSLIGGSITEQRSDFSGSGALWQLTMVAECSEQIAREQPAMLYKEDADD